MVFVSYTRIHRQKDRNYTLSCMWKTSCKVFQTGYFDEKILSDTYSKGKAEVFLESMRKDREYTSWDLLFNSGMHGFRYGETKIVKRDGKKYLVDKSVDFHGNKEIVREKLL